MMQRVKHAATRLPGFQKLTAQRDAASAEADLLRQQVAAQGYVPAGHFYSPIPDWDDVAEERDRIFTEPGPQLAGIDLRERQQLELVRALSGFYGDMPFGPERRDGLRYWFENPAYSYSDGILLYCMIRHANPSRIIEVGSGFSSCVILDTNDLHFAGAIETTFIEPFPALLESLLAVGDRVRIVEDRLQNVGLDEFDHLRSGDILFIDSTHVSKVGSDVNRIVFDILPRLAPGVFVHVHDIHYPFEYPEVWVSQGRAWNEAYLLRAFLQFNSDFDIVLMSTFLATFHPDALAEHLPLCLKNPGGSIWLRRKDTQ